MQEKNHKSLIMIYPQSKVKEANVGPPGDDRPEVDPIMATWTLLSSRFITHKIIQLVAAN